MRAFSWVHTHSADSYVKKALKEGYRSRAAYKLIEINERYRLIMPRMTILDLGAAPGGWAQVAVKEAKANKTFPTVVAADRSEILPIEGCQIVEIDLMHPNAISTLQEKMNGKADVLLSDMSDKHSGDTDVDSTMTYELNLVCLKLALDLLKPSGSVVMKLLMGAEEDAHFVRFMQHFCKNYFYELQRFKPKASRPESKELYYVGKGWKATDPKQALKLIVAKNAGKIHEPTVLHDKTKYGFMEDGGELLAKLKARHKKLP